MGMLKTLANDPRVNMSMRINRAVGDVSLFGLTLCLLASPPTALAAAPKGRAPIQHTARNPYLGAIVVDAASGRVLFEDHADAKGYPASVLKLMDLLILLEKIQQGQLSLQDQVVASAKASHTGGSRVYLKEAESFPLDEMLYALMVQSANDAAVALAEKVGGSTEAFVDLMNQRAAALGMKNTLFHSVHGLPPGAGQQADVTTARDLSLVCLELLKHPDTLRYTSTRYRPFRTNVPGKQFDMRTHNHLLGHLDGCDGFKTGYITAAGFSIAVTAARHGQRVVVVVLDSADIKVRDAKAAELVNKGFAMLSGATGGAPAAAGKKAAR
jgi:D-alanyl-D-alanine carboxypeptidase (penicillin-binding protein 5/6)